MYHFLPFFFCFIFWTNHALFLTFPFFSLLACYTFVPVLLFILCICDYLSAAFTYCIPDSVRLWEHFHSTLCPPVIHPPSPTFCLLCHYYNSFKLYFNPHETLASLFFTINFHLGLLTHLPYPLLFITFWISVFPPRNLFLLN